MIDRVFDRGMEFDIFRYVLIFLTSFGHKLGTFPHLFGFRVTSRVPDKGQVNVQYSGDVNSARSYPFGRPNAGDRPVSVPERPPVEGVGGDGPIAAL